MASNEKIQGVSCGIIVKSIATAIALDLPKHKKSCIVVAYLLTDNADDVKFIALKLPKKTLTRNDVLTAIKRVEGGKAITYVDFDGKDKDIYVCRSKDGEVYDFVERDDMKNRYVDGFAEIESGLLKFSTNATDFKYDDKIDAKVTFRPEVEKYERDTFCYAIINAYNACLLGKVFSRSEFQLETGDGERAKIEVRTISAKYVDLSIIYVKPEIIEGENVINSYLTEPVNVIDGYDMSQRSYRLVYRRSMNDYVISRCD